MSNRADKLANSTVNEVPERLQKLLRSTRDSMLIATRGYETLHEAAEVSVQALKGFRLSTGDALVLATKESDIYRQLAALSQEAHNTLTDDVKMNDRMLVSLEIIRREVALLRELMEVKEEMLAGAEQMAAPFHVKDDVVVS